jgi:serine protease Do
VSRRLLVVLLPALLAWSSAAAAFEWGWLGVRIRDISEQEMNEISGRHGIEEGFGAMIVEVLKDTPAERAGLKNGDLVVAFGERPVVDTRGLQRLVARTSAGEEVALTVLREEEGRRRLVIRLGRMPREVVAERIAAEMGFSVREIAGGEAGRPADLPAGPSVSVVLRGSLAERAGLRTGDVIVEVNGRSVASREAVGEALLAAPLDQPVRLTVQRPAGRARLSLDARELRVP